MKDDNTKSQHECTQEERLEAMDKKLDKIITKVCGDDTFHEDGMIITIQQLKRRLYALEKKYWMAIAFSSGVSSGISVMVTLLIK